MVWEGSFPKGAKFKNIIILPCKHEAVVPRCKPSCMSLELLPSYSVEAVSVLVPNRILHDQKIVCIVFNFPHEMQPHEYIFDDLFHFVSINNCWFLMLLKQKLHCWWRVLHALLSYLWEALRWLLIMCHLFVCFAQDSGVVKLVCSTLCSLVEVHGKHSIYDSCPIHLPASVYVFVCVYHNNRLNSNSSPFLKDLL